MNKWIVKEFEEGYEAYFSAKMIADCPYMPANEKAKLWCEGYAHAKIEEILEPVEYADIDFDEI